LRRNGVTSAWSNFQTRHGDLDRTEDAAVAAEDVFISAVKLSQATTAYSDQWFGVNHGMALHWLTET